MDAEAKEFSINLHPAQKLLNAAYQDVMDFLNWTKVAIVYEDDYGKIMEPQKKLSECWNIRSGSDYFYSLERPVKILAEPRRSQAIFFRRSASVFIFFNEQIDVKCNIMLFKTFFFSPTFCS